MMSFSNEEIVHKTVLVFFSFFLKILNISID